MPRQPVLSRHRLPRPYRLGLAGLWLTPIGLLLLTVVLRHGFQPALLDPRFWLPLAAMALPALYVWREGIDVLAHGIVRRIHWPRYYAYEQLACWDYDDRPERRVLTVWDDGRCKVVEVRAGHLTDTPLLLRALNQYVGAGSGYRRESSDE